MEAIAGTLGLNLNGFIWHTINFLILLALLRLVLFKPITRILDERARRVRESLERADEVRLQTERAESDRQALLLETRREAEAIRARADDQAKRILAEAQAKTLEETERAIAQATANIEASRQQMMADVRTQVADLVVTAVDRVTRHALDANAQRTLIQQFLSTEAGGANGTTTAVGSRR